MYVHVKMKVASGMTYREDLIKLFQDFVNQHRGEIFFVGNTDFNLPERIMHIDYILIEDAIALQDLYWKYLQSVLGEMSIFGTQIYATEIDTYLPRDYDIRITKAGVAYDI